MITPNDLEMVKDLIEKQEKKDFTKELDNLLNKVNILLEYDKLNSDYQTKKQELSKKLEELSE